MFKRIQSVTWVVFVISTYREKSHTRGVELVDWQAALKHPCWARFMCFIPTRWILIEKNLTTTQLPQTFSFLFLQLPAPSTVHARVQGIAEELNLWNASICIGYEITGFLFRSTRLSFTLFICKASFVQAPQGLQVVESRFYTAPRDNVFVFNDSLNGGALVWLSKVKMRLPRPKQPGILWLNH